MNSRASTVVVVVVVVAATATAGVVLAIVVLSCNKTDRCEMFPHIDIQTYVACTCSKNLECDRDELRGQIEELCKMRAGAVE